jgi:hypothetical protein
VTNLLAYGLQKTRITLYATDGTTPTLRVTLQKEDREGLSLEFAPEGPTTKLGSGAGWANQHTHHGWRPTLAITWSAGLTSSVETWSGSAWGAAADMITPIALSKILNAGMQAPCLVEPHLDKAYNFSAQPDPGKPFKLRDLKGIVHTGLELTLIGQTLADDLPDWLSL